MSKHNGVFFSLVISAIVFVLLLIVNWINYFRIVPEMLIPNLLISISIFIITYNSYKKGYGEGFADAARTMFSSYLDGFEDGYTICMADYKQVNNEPDEEGDNYLEGKPDDEEK